MSKVERIREPLTFQPTAEYWNEKLRQGWRPVAIEWERPVAAGDGGELRVAIPFGLQVAEGGEHLMEHPAEHEALRLMLALIEEDCPLSNVARELNRRGFRTRGGGEWTQVAVFQMLPRLIEVAPEIQAGAAWRERKERLLKLVG